MFQYRSQSRPDPDQTTCIASISSARARARASTPPLPRPTPTTDSAMRLSIAMLQTIEDERLKMVRLGAAWCPVAAQRQTAACCFLPHHVLIFLLRPTQLVWLEKTFTEQAEAWHRESVGVAKVCVARRAWHVARDWGQSTLSRPLLSLPRPSSDTEK